MTDTGVAYGNSDWEGDDIVTAEVEIATGKAKAIERSLVPLADRGGFGVFFVGFANQLVFYPHA
ncbi:hypothetical protein AB0I53_46685 [Saccharopolyspora sp. NPDC050389]|uniref:hypothetical protein n=1 Tax=Saccharopolyspora sp. NPDC050389 TaxID=3155516 RepID=UPI0033DAC76B